MPRDIRPDEYNLPPIPLKLTHKPAKCHDCGETVEAYRWSKFWCPDHDILRMARIGGHMNQIEATLNGLKERK